MKTFTTFLVRIAGFYPRVPRNIYCLHTVSESSRKVRKERPLVAIGSSYDQTVRKTSDYIVRGHSEMTSYARGRGGGQQKPDAVGR